MTLLNKKPVLGLVAVALATLGATASANTYPNKPITMVVPFSAGGGADNAARIIAQALQEVSGQTVVVENKAGASGSIGANYVARAKGDGYTILYDASSFALNPVLRKLPYDAKKDFIPVSQAVVVPNILVVAANSPFKTLDTIVKTVKANPGKHHFASYGPGSLAQMAAELLKKEADLDMIHIPYKGGAPALVDVMSGQVDMYFANAASSLNYVTSGKLHAVAVTSDKRMPELPDVPTVAESGFKDFSVYEWNGIFLPKGTPADVVGKLESITREALGKPEVQEKLGRLGLTTVGSSSADFKVFLEQEEKQWTDLVKANQISVD